MSRDPFFRITVSVSKVSGLEGFWSRSQALRLEILHRLFFMNFCKELLKKRNFKKWLFKIQPFKEISGKVFFVVMLFARWRKQFALYPV